MVINMIVKGNVYKLSGNYAHVKTPRPKACESCSNYSICSGKDVDMKVLNTIGAKIGDTVEVEISEDQRAIYIMAYIFLIPVALIFIGYGLYTISALCLFALIPMIVAYAIGLYLLNKKFKLKSEIIQITEDSAPECNKN
ncbi:MAG: SoxR reducing system RseC family protein [Clostridia bacterium]|nr:SoxR reducing system RseC family protein [Clostridia bacterium]